MARRDVGGFEEPRFARLLFASTSWPVFIWLAIRLYLGYEWLRAGIEKVSDPAWWDGTAVQGFATFASTELTQGEHPPVAFGWYAAFLRWIADTGYPVVGPIVAVGEVVIGALLLLGLFTGIAAFLAATLTLTFGLAGSAGLNPLFLVFEMLLILAWRNAGYIGLDRWVLPALGTPWQRGYLWRREEPDGHPTGA